MAVPFLNISNDFEGRKILVSSEGKTSAAVRLEGTLPEYMNTGQEFLADGRFFTDYENETSQKVAVLRGAVAEHFFPYTSPVGKTIKIDGDDFRVVGALTMRTFLFQGSGSSDLNNGIFIPFKEARKIKPSATDVFILTVARPGKLEEAKDQVVDLLRRRRGVPYGDPDNFGLATADSVIDNFRSITFGIAVSMITISSIGLIVGGIGVMNIMLMSVKERTREIGVRRALGARRRDILSQFLVEAVTLTGIGGLIGLGLGWLSSFLIKLFVPSYVPLWAPLVGFLVSVSIGLVSGLWPAWKAARLNPVESLRYE
jgi:putative ABC transport system permease protein